ncbi:9351_t:CDS:1, partial [Gigaspora margarita]
TKYENVFNNTKGNDNRRKFNIVDIRCMMIELKELNRKVSVISACKKDVDKAELKRKK